MAKVILTPEARLSDRIIRSLPKNKDVAAVNGLSQQAQLYRTRNVYPKLIVEMIHVLDLAGYEIKEKQ